MIEEPTNDVLRTTLKHLHVRRDNMSRSRDEANGHDVNRFQKEVDDLTDAITYFEQIRSDRGI